MILKRNSHHLILRKQMYTTCYMMYLHMAFTYGIFVCIMQRHRKAMCCGRLYQLMKATYAHLSQLYYEFIYLTGSLKLTMQDLRHGNWLTLQIRFSPTPVQRANCYVFIGTPLCVCICVCVCACTIGIYAVNYAEK